MSKIDRRSLIVGALSLAGCKRLAARKGGTKQVTCPAGEHRITVPAHWDRGGLKNEQAEILQGSVLDAAFVTVVAEPLEDFADGLEGYAELLKNVQTKQLSSPSFDPPVPREIHGMRALYREFRGVVNGLNLVYLGAYIEAPRHYVQVTTWTAKSRLAQHRPTLMAVLDSFEALER